MTVQNTKLRVLTKSWNDLGDFQAWIEGEGVNYCIIQQPVKADEEGNYSVTLQKEGSSKPMKLQVMPGTTPVVLQIHDETEETEAETETEGEKFSAKDLLDEYQRLVTDDENFIAWITTKEGNRLYLNKSPQRIIRTGKYRLSFTPEKGKGEVSTVDVDPGYIVSTNYVKPVTVKPSPKTKTEETKTKNGKAEILELAQKLTPVEMISLAQELIGEAKAKLAESEE